MTQSYALELGPKGVRVNAIAPGLIQTALSEYYWKNDERRAALLEKQPIARIGQPKDVAEVALLSRATEAHTSQARRWWWTAASCLPGL